jgi:hypothetical protein
MTIIIKNNGGVELAAKADEGSNWSPLMGLAPSFV